MKAVDEHNPNAVLVEAVRRLDRLGLLRGGMAALSMRSGGGLLITPLGFAPDSLAVDDPVFIARDGGIKGRGQPSADWAVHQAIYQTHADVHAVAHLQSTHATALACLKRALPAFHHRVAVAGGDSVPCVPYHSAGSTALAQAVVETLAHRHACLIAHDGLLASGNSMSHALSIALEIEGLCQSYLAALAVAEPPRLGRAEMARAIDQLQTYTRAAPRG